MKLRQEMRGDRAGVAPATQSSNETGEGGQHQDVVSNLWSAKWWILGIATAAAALTVGVSAALEPMYESTATVRVVVQPSDASPRETILASNDLAAQYARLADASPVVGPAADRLGERASVLGAAVSAGTVGEQNLVNVRAQASDAALAGRRANEVARAFVGYIRRVNARQATALTTSVERELGPLDRAIERARDELATAQSSGVGSGSAGETLLAQLIVERQQLAAQLARTAALAQPSIELVVGAAPGRKVEPRPVLYAVIAFFAVGLVAAQLFALVRGSRRPSAA